ncbi:L-serine ammonia-lyase, iron-sulfur-dependent subunit beta [Paenibacillus lutrae]|uniref:L-serine deaminase n=1 Tax=Paenibacillus lutrae TaxID=2078573 RepID=A0A7X3FH89_9BACL|nr:L-serine ammonia-lyase, iron-sulfur-dependent subunit beta [Paenibacillus lutrae]MVO99567.1 L-serine ammonia-lyase, iron-sulfur-dependent, subunit beta [Paenibacillus lutrae]
MRFKDVFSIIGPSMIGPSSSHTAGAIRLGRVARQLFGELPEKAELTFFGSFADTYRGHGTDLAVVGGLLDYETDHPRIPDSLEDAEAAGMEVIFQTSSGQHTHPNTARISLSSGEREMTVVGASIGGGNIEILSVNQFDLKFTGEFPTLVISHLDRPGMIADITALLQRKNLNIGYMDLDRKGRGGEAMTVIEADSPVTGDLIAEVKQLSMVEDVRTVDLAERGQL